MVARQAHVGALEYDLGAAGRVGAVSGQVAEAPELVGAGVVVSRVNLSPRFMKELIDAMSDNYSKWQTKEGIKNLPEFDGPEET